MEAETGTTRLQSRNNFTHIVADKTETRVLAILFDDYKVTRQEGNKWITSTKGKLGSIGHIVSFIKNNKLGSRTKQFLSSSKVFDLLTDNIDTAVIRSIELCVCRYIYEHTSRIMFERLLPYNILAHAIIVVVFPVPGGP